MLADTSKDAKSADGGPKPKRSNLKSFIINALRRATYRWPPRSEALKTSRKERGLYQCKYCEEYFKNKECISVHDGYFARDKDNKEIDIASGVIPALNPYEKTNVDLTCGKLFETGVEYIFKVTVNPDEGQPVELHGKLTPVK